MEVALSNCRDARELKTSERKDSDVGRGGGDDEDDADDHDHGDASDDVKVIKMGLVADGADEDDGHSKESAPIITSNGDAKSVTDDDEDDAAAVAKAVVASAVAVADITATDEPIQRVDAGLVINGSGGDKDKDLDEEDVVSDKARVEVDNGEKVATTPTEKNDNDGVDDDVIQQQEEDEEAEPIEEVVDDAASIDKEDAKVISEEDDEELDGEEPVDDLKAGGDGLRVSTCSARSVSVLVEKKPTPTTTEKDVDNKKFASDEASVSNADVIDTKTEAKDGKKEKTSEAAKSESKETAAVEAKKPPVPPAKKKDQSSTSSSSKYGDNKEQTIIITETKSLAKAINDAVKQPDGKPTLVIIETKPGANATTATSTATPSSNGVVLSARSSVTINSPVRRLTTMPMLKNQLSSIDYNGGAAAAVAAAAAAVVSPARQVGRPPSLLQGTLLASPITRFTPKPDPGPSVPLPDDAEVSVDVPSLVVPYLFECQARETLTHFLKKLGPLEEPNSEVMKPEQMSPTAAAIDSVARGIVGGKTYFDTTLGKFLMDIGLVQVQEWVQGEILKSQQRKLNKGWKTKEREKMVAGLKRTMEDSKRRTGQFRFALRKCPRCTFLSESSTVLDKHMETIHLAPGSTTRMLCCFCNYATEEAAAIFNHVYVKHGAFARLEKFHNCHMCPLCPFEDANKSRVTRHTWKCQKAYAPERNLAPSPDYEPPAKRTRLVASVATLKSMSASRQQQQQQQQMHQQSGNVLRDNLMSRGGAAPPPIRPKPGELRITPSYVQSVLRSSYVPPSTNVSRTVSQLLTSAHQSYVRSASAPGPRVSSPSGGGMGNNSTLLLSRNQLQTNVNQPYTIQPSQLYQVVNAGSNVGGGGGSSGGGVLPVVRGTVGPFQSQPRFTILPTPPVTVTTRGPTPVALIPNLATTGHSSSFAAQMRSGNVSIGSNASQLRNMSGSSSGGVTRPNISITPVNKGMSGASRLTTQAQPTSGTRTSQQQQQQQQQQSSGGGGSNSSYVVCEICDGYIKDLDQLRNHMQWIHKVKIHPKMIHNRPPLNCQKCHYRFFTDQGLERHLLGSHGLVTSSMQDNANKGKDGGRCIICGKVFLWKLVVHMAKDHKMTLKPAHLSYKCTVCSATFNMYRLFETHVYEEHSTVAKRVLDTPKPAAAAAAVAAAAAAAAAANKPKVSAAVSSSKDVVTVRSVSSSSSVTVTETKGQSSSSAAVVIAAAAAAAAQKPTSSEQTSSPVRSCVECGIKFQCSSNCLDHMKESHVRPCRVELCRVDKCHKCTAKSQRKKDKDVGAAGTKKNETVTTVEDDDDDIVELDVVRKEKTKPEVVVIVDRDTQPAADEQGGDDVFDMEVETVDDHSSIAGSVQTDVESD